jgi:hypothetical protein
MVVLLTYGLCNRKKPVSHLTSAARLACSVCCVYPPKRNLRERPRGTRILLSPFCWRGYVIGSLPALKKRERERARATLAVRATWRNCVQSL